MKAHGDHPKTPHAACARRAERWLAKLTGRVMLWLLAGTFVCLGGCIWRPRPSAPVLAQPVRPQMGRPLNAAVSWAYLEREARDLWQRGDLPAGLLRGPSPGKCAVKPLPASVTPLEPTELAERLESSVAVVGRVGVIGSRPQLVYVGTGFFISESGALVTCRCCFDTNALGLLVMTRDGQVCPVRGVLAADTNYDLVVLQVDGKGFTPLPIAGKAQHGESVWVLSHAGLVLYSLTSGAVSDYATYPKTGRIYFHTTADFATFSAGAPVVNASGAVVGIAFKAEVSHVYPYAGTEQGAQTVERRCIPSSVLLGLFDGVRP